MPISTNTNRIINELHPDWKAFSGKAAKGVLFTNFAYKNTDKKMQELASSMPPNYELFLMTDHVEDVKEASFRSVAFINYEAKEIVFATAGTRAGLNMTGVNDLIDDALLVVQKKPRKMNPAQILNDMILDSLGDAAKDYKFHYTGHSLGAAMAEMQAADMDIKLTQRDYKKENDLAQITAVTFENPGTKKILEKMYEKAGLPKKCVNNLNLCEFNNRKNVINNLNTQAGRTYTIIPDSQKEKTLMSMVLEVVAKYLPKLIPILKPIFKLCNLVGLHFDVISDHKLGNFNEVFVQGKGSVKQDGQVVALEKAYTDIQPVEYDVQIANKISSMKIQHGNIGKQKFSMSKMNPDTNSLDCVVFSLDEVKAAKKGWKNIISQKRGSIANKIKQEIKSKKSLPSASKFKLPTISEITNLHILK